MFAGVRPLPYIKNMNSATHTTETKLTAAQFADLCDAVRDCRASLAGCRESESIGEAAHLRRALTELTQAKLARKNDRLECRRSLLVVGATDALIKHSTRAVNDAVEVGTYVEFKGNLGANGAIGMISAILDGGTHFMCSTFSKAPIPMALLKTSQWRVVQP